MWRSEAGECFEDAQRNVVLRPISLFVVTVILYMLRVLHTRLTASPRAWLNVCQIEGYNILPSLKTASRKTYATGGYSAKGDGQSREYTGTDDRV